MSVIGEAKKVTVTGRGQKKPIPKASLQCDSPPTDTAALGSLMMVDFAAFKSTASLVNIWPCEAARAREAQGGGHAVQKEGRGRAALKSEWKTSHRGCHRHRQFRRWHRWHCNTRTWKDMETITVRHTASTGCMVEKERAGLRRLGVEIERLDFL